MAIVHEAAGDASLSASEKVALLEDFDEVLGLGIANWKGEAIPDDILALAEKREEARKNKDWAAADSYRDTLLSRGYAIKDTPTGPKVTKA